MSKQNDWAALNALITDALNSPCTVEAPEGEDARRSLADALTDELCNDVVVNHPSARRRW